MEQGLYFDSVARLYDSVRPGYLSLLIDDLLWLSKLPQDGRILDVGCGTGKSTMPFAARGFPVCALDPGSNMLAVCMRKLERYPNVTYANARFEDWSAGEGVFDLVVSGTAFHWVTEGGYRQLLRVLKPQAYVGIFWHTYLGAKDPLHAKLSLVYRKHAPELYVDDPDATQELADRRKEERMLSWPGFGGWRVIRYYDSVRYSATQYLDLLRTFPNHANLDVEFFASVGSLIEDSGGEIVKPIRTTLCFGRRSGPGM